MSDNITPFPTNESLKYTDLINTFYMIRDDVKDLSETVQDNTRRLASMEATVGNGLSDRVRRIENLVEKLLFVFIGAVFTIITTVVGAGIIAYFNFL